MTEGSEKGGAVSNTGRKLGAESEGHKRKERSNPIICLIMLGKSLCFEQMYTKLYKLAGLNLVHRSVKKNLC